MAFRAQRSCGKGHGSNLVSLMDSRRRMRAQASALAVVVLFRRGEFEGEVFVASRVASLRSWVAPYAR